jgi:hypothetical protein
VWGQGLLTPKEKTFGPFVNKGGACLSLSSPLALLSGNVSLL